MVCCNQYRVTVVEVVTNTVVHLCLSLVKQVVC